MGTFKTIAILGGVANTIEFAQGEILLLQVGVHTQTIPNPTLGTATWTYTLRVDNVNTNINFAAGQGIAQVCFFEGTSAGVATPLGAMTKVLPAAGTGSGVATVSGSLEADKEFAGTAAGVATALGSLEADKEFAGTAAGVATASGEAGLVEPTIGTVDIGAGGGVTGGAFPFVG